ncbi:MAG: methyltransferase domain-containing protein [Bacteroidales bacterium]|nr:methyltransferase domain-containing protein [Bacteroidales bacterium]
MKNDWNPELYLQFEKERRQPSIDLVSRIDKKNPQQIIDIGCGPGNSTQVLRYRWPDSKIMGIDNSEAMIAKAKRDYPDQDWNVFDAATEMIPGKFDIVFSNATIQWIPDHPGLFRKFTDMLSDGGILAVQIPLFWNMPLGKSIQKTSRMVRWANRIGKIHELFTIHNPVEYFEMLSKLFDRVEIWKTDYIHIMETQEAILEMIRSTGLRPYLDQLGEDEKSGFTNLILEGIKRDYPHRENGKVLFPFERLFLIGEKC